MTIDEAATAAAASDELTTAQAAGYLVTHAWPPLCSESIGRDPEEAAAGAGRAEGLKH